MSLSTRRLFVAILFLALFAMALREISDPDFWWHLRTGQYIVENRVIPHTDVFSFTSTDKEWVTHEWLSEVIIYSLYRAAGLPLLVVLFAGIIAASFGLLYLRCEGRPFIAGFAVLLGALATAPTWGVRPQMLSLLLSSVFLLQLDKYLVEPRARYLVPLPLLTLLWVNVHSGYALGLGIIAVYLVGIAIDRYFGSDLRSNWSALASLGIALALSLVAVLFNPNGARMFSYPIETLTSPTMRQYIQEWFSPDFHQLEFQPFAILLLGLVGAGIVSRIRVPAAWFLLVVLFGLAALQSARNIPLFVLVAIPVLACQLNTLVQARDHPHPALLHPPSRAAGYLNLLLLVILASAVALRALTIIGNQSQVVQKQFPVAATKYIQEHKPAGNIYNEYGWGGYLIWRLYPEYRVYIDGRADVYGDKFIEDYLDIYRARPGWDKELAARGVNLALLEPDAPLARALGTTPEWSQVFADSQSVVFVRR